MILALIVIILLLILIFFYIQDRKSSINQPIRQVANKSTMTHSSIHKYSKHHTRSRTANNINDFIKKIERKYVDKEYLFNASSSPIVENDDNTDKYLKYIRKDIRQWGSELVIIDLKVKNTIQTDSEFVIRIDGKFMYGLEMACVRMKYYGIIQEQDDIQNPKAVCELQLISIFKISDRIFQEEPQKVKPFMTMSEQLAYVNKINELHKNEEY
jgi:hypothetical protein